MNMMPVKSLKFYQYNYTHVHILHILTYINIYVNIHRYRELSQFQISNKWLGIWQKICCHSSGIYELSIRQIRRQLQVLHGVDDHDLVHLVHDVPLVEKLKRGLLPTNLMLEMPRVYCVQKVFYLQLVLLWKRFSQNRTILTLLITAMSFSGISEIISSSGEMLNKVRPYRMT